jgi:hypothetical protein
VILLFFACLPHNSLSRQAEQPAQRYQLGVALVEQAEAVPALGWEMAATLDLAYTRTFRDRSIGTLVQFSGVHATMNGQEVPNRLEGLLVEMRAFDRGEVLSILGADAGIGHGGNLEKFDVLWPALVPRVEGEGADLQLLTSWPVGENRDLGRSRLDARGQVLGREGSILSMRWDGEILQSDRIVNRKGTVHAEVQVECARVVARVGGGEDRGQGEGGNKVGFCFHAGYRLRICGLLGKRVAHAIFMNLSCPKQRGVPE